MNKCSICGGTVIINVDSALGICDSCGNHTEIEAETVKKYNELLGTAERRMMLNSLKGFSEALDILNDIPFVDGAEERIRTCNKKISELKKKELERQKSKAESDRNDSKAGIIIFAVLVVLFLALAAAIGFGIYKLVNGNITQTEIFIIVGILVAAIALISIGKSRV